MNACGFVFQARCRLSSHVNSVEFPPVCNHSDSILPQPVRNAAMTMILMLLLCIVARDGGFQPHPLGMPSIADSARGSYPIPASWRDRARDLAPCVACGKCDNVRRHFNFLHPSQRCVGLVMRNTYATCTQHGVLRATQRCNLRCFALFPRIFGTASLLNEVLPFLHPVSGRSAKHRKLQRCVAAQHAMLRACCVCVAYDKTHATLQIVDKLLPYSKLPAKPPKHCECHRQP